MTHERPVQTGDEITICVPAAGAYVSVLRTMAAGIAARADLNLDDIDDLRMAVDEACALLLHVAVPGTNLECRIVVQEEGLDVAVTAFTASEPQEPPTTSFAWTVLTALAQEVRAIAEPPDRLSVRLRKVAVGRR